VAHWFFSQSNADLERWSKYFIAFVVFQYFEYCFQRVQRLIQDSGGMKHGMKQVMDSIEYKLDVVSDTQAGSGEMREAMTTLRNIEHKLDILLANLG